MAPPDPDPELERFKFEQLKWKDEIRLRQQSIDIEDRAQKSKDDEIKLRKEELNSSRWSSPLVIAILGATLAAAGNLVVNLLNAYEQRQLENDRSVATETLEKEKAEAARILEVVKTGDPDKAAENLRVLLDTHLISDTTTRDNVQAYLENRQAGQGIALSATGGLLGNSITQYQPLPPPTGRPPYHLELSNILGERVERIVRSGKLLFQVAGDTGGMQNYQALVAQSMASEFRSANPEDQPAFLYLLGNVVFFNGEAENYPAQFYQPYAFYSAPIFAIPGNHDGSIPVESQRRSLEGYVSNFCAATQEATPETRGRKTMVEPNVYWTLLTPFATIVGLYTNVPEGGALDAVQVKWLHDEMKAAPRDKALIIAMHSSPFSFDLFHSGSPRMLAMLRDAINDTRRVPNAILSAGAFDYQRIELDISGTKIPFFVIGNGGYPNLRKISAKPPAPNSDMPEAVLVAANGDSHGFASFEVSAGTIKGHFTVLGTATNPTATGSTVADTFSYSSAPIILPAGEDFRLPSALENKAAAK